MSEGSSPAARPPPAAPPGRGGMRTMVLLVDDQVVTGFNPSRYEAILGLPHDEATA